MALLSLNFMMGMSRAWAERFPPPDPPDIPLDPELLPPPEDLEPGPLPETEPDPAPEPHHTAAARQRAPRARRSA